MYRHLRISRSTGNSALPFAVSTVDEHGRTIDTNRFESIEAAGRWSKRVGLRVWDTITSPDRPAWLLDEDDKRLMDLIPDAYSDEEHAANRCSDCGNTGELVTTPGGSRVCRDCWMGENWQD
jgi:hypothetical protein